MTHRINFALEAGGLTLPAEGRIALFGAPADAGLPAGLDPARLEVIQPLAPEADAWTVRGIATRPTPQGPYAAALVTLPRARDLAEARMAEAEAATPEGLIVLDGAKTDGVEPMLKALKARLTLSGQLSKAHGKILWYTNTGALTDWTRPAMHRNPEGDWVAPGVFSADAADPASRALAEALPARIKGTVADLGAGWGWLSRELLKAEGVKTLHLVEADRAALDCARENVTDDRARFHWADALRWRAPAALDAVVMNPPFHAGRKGDPSIGQAFIATAARILEPHGQLWLVANRHLPYEATLAEHFRETSEVGGTSKFKILTAARPTRARR